MKITLNVAVCICAFTLLSCQTGNESLCTVQATMPTNTSQVIPLETALATLSDFLESNEAGMLPTRSGRTREIASVSRYFGKSVSSRASSDSGEETPVAYLVNFMDGEGFAVLGARSSVPDIVAVTESGRIDDDLTVRFSMSDDDIANDEDKDDPNDNPGEDPDDLISYYCEEDGDYYSDADCNEAFISECIRAGISEAEDNEYDEGDRPIEDEGGGGGYVPYTTRSPMLKTNWGQNDPYNRYCFRRNLVGKKKQALTGCTTTAMSMIVTCNEFPQTLEINGEILGWKGMKTSDLATSLSDKGQDDVARLMGGIYNSVSKIARKEYTLITPEQIKKRMREFGYDNVEKHSASSLNSAMIKRTSDIWLKESPC